MPLPADFELENAEVFDPLLQSARYKGAYGGRGGGKDYFFADMLIDHALNQRGLFGVLIREVQKTLRDSAKRLLELRIANYFRLGEADGFKIFRDVIETPGDGLLTFTGMQNHTAESIKSIESADRFFWNEAQTATPTSLKLLRPTVRKKDAELWFAWNPKRPPDPDNPVDSVDGLMRGTFGIAAPKNSVCVKALWDDNPWFPEGLNEDRLHDLNVRRPEDYGHIWGGEFETHSEARVFHNWKVADFLTPPEAIFMFGGDFGFARDPSVLVRCFVGDWVNTGVVDADGSVIMRAEYNPYGKHLFIDQEAWRIGCDVDHLPALYAGSNIGVWDNPYGDAGIEGSRSYEITADSSNPQSISYLNRQGFNVQPAIKGPGSIEEGVEFLKSYTIIVHSRCPKVAHEFTYYSFQIDKDTGRILPKLEDKKNHTIDSVRYATEAKRRGGGWFG